MHTYKPEKIEKKWQKKWEDHKTFAAKHDSNLPKFYGLVEFPYPSGAGLHVGHPRSYTAMDVITRARRMQGYNVLYPMGWDAFGLPTENYAIKTGRPPVEVTKENIANFERQLKSLGYGFDWDRTVNTTDPAYYTWTQWIFLKLFEKGLAYKQNIPINWCLDCKIGLANEEVVDGRCERCGGPVEKRDKEQWMLAITTYADSLLAGLDDVDYIPQAKTQQTNWIGRSEGAEIDFLIPKYTEILFATSNTSKVARVKKLLERRNIPITVHTPEDLGIKIIDIEENGTLAENALKKAQAYAAYTDLPILALDTGLFIAGSEVDPVSVKRNALGDIPEADLSQAEIAQKMIAYYQLIAQKHGGSVQAEFVDSWVLIDPKEQTVSESVSQRPITLTNTVKEPIDEFFPIRSLYTADATGMYPPEYTDAEEFAELLPVTKSLTQLLTHTMTVFTSRPDTLFGATYCVMSPEHHLLDTSLKDQITNWSDAADYIDAAKMKSDLERTELQKEKTGVQLEGVFAINPANGDQLPVYIADYVLTFYGTGAIMAVPAHDARDHVFAKKYNLPIKEVVRKQVGKRVDDFEQRDSAKAVIIKDGKVLLVKSTTHEHGYGLPGGGIEVGETAAQTVSREVIEETGYTDFEIDEALGTVEQNSYFEAKKVNRRRILSGFVVRLLSDNQQKQSDADHDRLTLVWEKPHKAIELLEKSSELYMKCPSAYAEFVRRATDTSYCFSESGMTCNSDFLIDISTQEAKEKIITWLASRELGKKKINYKLRDWVFSRQRYWGEPIPLVYCEHCAQNHTPRNDGEAQNPGWIPLSTNALPLTLPHVDKYEPTDTGESPLAAITDWVKTTCPVCGGAAQRETDTMPNWAGSSWYFLRYIDPNNDAALASKEALAYWGQVDWYNGGMEHTVLHLLYSRFWNQFLFDIGVVPHKEPYAKRTSHGMILAKGGEKMSKSKGNVVNPDEMIEKFGADALRGYILFMGPFDQAAEWDTNGLVGVRRFVEKFWKLFDKIGETSDKKFEAQLHATIKKVTEDIDAMQFNTAIAKMMELTNAGQKVESIAKSDYAAMVKILAPFMPHTCEELWEMLGNTESVAHAAWPTYEEAKLVEDIAKIAIQVNGKVRATIEIPVDADPEAVKGLALSDTRIKKWVTSKPKKVIYVPGRLVSIVV